MAKYLLSGGQDRTIRLWNPGVGVEIEAYSGHGYGVLSTTVDVPKIIAGIAVTSPTTPAVCMIIVNLRLQEETSPSSYGM